MVDLFPWFEDKGFVHLGWADVGFIYVFSKNPIKTPDDMNSARMWIWAGDPLAELFFKAFGISPIPLSAPDVLTSLQTGVIDAVYGSSLACVALQWFTRFIGFPLHCFRTSVFVYAYGVCHALFPPD